MDPFEDYLQENDVFEGNEDPNTFEEFLEPEEYIDHGQLFTTDRIFNLKVELVDWANETALKVNTYLIINRYLKSRTSDRRPFVTLKICNVVAKIKKNKMQGRKTMEEVLCLRFWFINYIFSLIITFHLYFKIKVQYATIRSRRMTLTGKNFTVATAFMRNEQATTYRLATHRSKCVGKINRNGRISYGLKMKWQRRPNFLHYLFNKWFNPLAHKFCRVWTSEVLHFGVETTNRTESEHLVPKLWLSTCYCDLDTMFLNINSLIEGQIAEIKSSLEISKLKENYSTKNNPILKNISNNISHLALKKIWLEIKRAREIVDNPQNKCRDYLRKSHGLPCACKLVGEYAHVLSLQAEDIYIFWGKIEIGVEIPTVHERDMDSEMRDLTSMLEEISMGPISKVRKVCRLIKDVISSMLPDDPCAPLTTPSPPPETAVTKGRRKTNSIERDKSYREHVSIAHRKTGKSSGSGSRFGRDFGFGSSSSARGRGSSYVRVGVGEKDVAVDKGQSPSYLFIQIWIALLECYASDSFRNNSISYSYRCEMDARYLHCRSNGNIIEIYESVGGQNLIMNELQSGLGEHVQNIQQKILFMYIFLSHNRCIYSLFFSML
ncbi:hypothetical protein M9H77_30706 [Catharanthus roseus]|uniref:Uncharacterized protein n=1 Tax=Catharanthus roseus TaxID=4058 RepID=A0ACC0A017_CATRO|nr:hypothetical protein M9H77_30706 [Catharanthus roseus]